MAKTDELVLREHIIGVLLSHHSENGSGHWSWVLAATGGGQGEALLDVLNSLADVHDEPSVCLLVLEHDHIVPSEVSIGRVRPWHLSVALLILGDSLSKWKGSISLLGSVVVFLDSVELKVFVPVTDSGLDGVFGSSLQLLGCVLHI